MPTTSVSSPPRAAKGTTAIEKADSLLSSGIKLTVWAWQTGKYLLRSDEIAAYVDWVDDMDARCPCTCRCFRSTEDFWWKAQHFFVDFFPLPPLYMDTSQH